MNPIPYGVPLPPTPLFPNGYVPLIMLLTVVAFLLTDGVLLRAMRSLTRRRERVHCPVHSRPATVVVRFAPDGSPRGVAHCSIPGRGPTTCAEACLHPTQA